MEVARESVQFLCLVVLAGKRRKIGLLKVVFYILRSDAWTCFGLCGCSRTELGESCDFIYSLCLVKKKLKMKGLLDGCDSMP